MPQKSRSSPSAPPAFDPRQVDQWGPFCSAFLPPRLDELALCTEAIQRRRQIQQGSTLLRLILLYVITGLSLSSTAAWAKQRKLASLTDEALRGRFRGSVALLELVVRLLLERALGSTSAQGPTLRIHDASTLSLPGSQGTDYRVEVTYAPGGSSVVGLHISPSDRERLQRAQVQPGDLVMGDQGMGYAKDIHAVHDKEAYCLVRVYLPGLPLLDKRGRPLDIQRVLNRADREDLLSFVQVPCLDRDPVPARLLVLPLPPEVTQRNRRRLRTNSRKQGWRSPRTRTLRLAGYLVVLTTLPVRMARTPRQILSWYRVRWQVELFLKRWKSLLGLSATKKWGEQMVQVHLLGKMIEAAVIDQLLQPAAQLRRPPVEVSLVAQGASLWRLTHLYWVALIMWIAGPVLVTQVLSERLELAERVRQRKRKRRLAQRVVEQILRHLSPGASRAVA